MMERRDMNSAGNGTISALFLVGATATGKTAVAQHIAESRGYSILSADSMLIYRGMNIGTAKPTLSERSRVNYYGLDLVDPDETFNVWQYRKYALSVLSRDTTFMVVGGSGLYIKSLTHGITDAGEASPAARAVFEALFQEKGKT